MEMENDEFNEIEEDGFQTVNNIQKKGKNKRRKK